MNVSPIVVTFQIQPFSLNHDYGRERVISINAWQVVCHCACWTKKGDPLNIDRSVEPQKIPFTFHYTACLIRIPIMAHYNPQLGRISSPKKSLSQPGFFFLIAENRWFCQLKKARNAENLHGRHPFQHHRLTIDGMVGHRRAEDGEL